MGNKESLAHFLGIVLLFSSACQSTVIKISASAETTPVDTSGDAADDIAVYYDKENWQQSLIIGTNKKKGLEIYNLEGSLVASFPFGKINNVDIAHLTFDSRPLIGGSNRSDNSLVFYFLNPRTQTLKPATRLPVKVSMEEVYGYCFAATDSEVFAIVSGTGGEIEIFKLSGEDDQYISVDPWHSFQLPSQTEGLVYDKTLKRLYLAEETSGVWQWDMDPQIPACKAISLSQYPQLKADLEGLAMYYSNTGTNYLLISSQGNNRYGIFESMPTKLLFKGVFKIQNTPDIDNTTDTDGIDIVSCKFGNQYSSGILIVQDGKNTRRNGKKTNQNFKIISWSDIARSFTPSLEKDPLCNY